MNAKQTGAGGSQEEWSYAELMRKKRDSGRQHTDFQELRHFQEISGKSGKCVCQNKPEDGVNGQGLASLQTTLDMGIAHRALLATTPPRLPVVC